MSDPQTRFTQIRPLGGISPGGRDRFRVVGVIGGQPFDKDGSIIGISRAARSFATQRGVDPEPVIEALQRLVEQRGLTWPRS